MGVDTTRSAWGTALAPATTTRACAALAEGERGTAKATVVTQATSRDVTRRCDVRDMTPDYEL